MAGVGVGSYQKKGGGGGINAWWIAPMPPLNSMKIEKCKIWTAFRIRNLTTTSCSYLSILHFDSDFIV